MNLQLLFDDGNQYISGDGAPDLRLYCVLAVANKSIESDPLLSHKTAKKRPEYPLLIYNEFLDNPLKDKGIQAMAHCNTVFLQLLKIVGRHEFEAIASLHRQSQYCGV
jgi:hypothetical protein